MPGAGPTCPSSRRTGLPSPSGGSALCQVQPWLLCPRRASDPPAAGPHSSGRCKAFLEAQQVSTVKGLGWGRVTLCKESPPCWHSSPERPAAPFNLLSLLLVQLPLLPWPLGTVTWTRPEKVAPHARRPSRPPRALRPVPPLTRAGLPSPGASARGRQGQEHDAQSQQDRHEGPRLPSSIQGLHTRPHREAPAPRTPGSALPGRPRPGGHCGGHIPGACAGTAAPGGDGTQVVLAGRAAASLYLIYTWAVVLPCR